MRLFIALVSLFLVETSFAASTSGKLLLFPVVPIADEMRPEVATKLTDEVLAALKEAAFETGLAPDVKLSGDVQGPASTKKVPVLAQALKDAKKQSDKMRFATAISTLENATQLATQNLETLNFDELAEAYLQLAVARLRSGKEGSAREALQSLARLQPERKLDAQIYPPAFLTMFDEIRVDLSSSKTGSVAVMGDAGAQVLLNGKLQCTSPCTVDDLPPGSHYVFVRRGGRQLSYSVTVQEGANTTVNVNFSDSPDTHLSHLMATNRFDGHVRRTARNYAKSKKAEWVLLAVAGAGDSVYALGAFLGNVRTDKWYTLPPFATDMSLKMVKHEAQLLTKELQEKIQTPNESIEEDELPFIAGKNLEIANTQRRPVVARIPPENNPVIADTEAYLNKPTDKPAAWASNDVGSDVVSDTGSKKPWRVLTPEERSEDQRLRRLIARVNEIAAVKPTSAAEIRESRVTDSWVFWAAISAGVLVAAGGGTAFFIWHDQRDTR